MSPVTPQWLTLLPLGYTRLPLPTGPLDMVLGCYLIELSDGRHVLIDSGLPADYPSPPGVPAAEDESNVLAQLAALGLNPADIDLLICSHFDVDHVGYHQHFTRAECLVQRTHYEMATGGHPRYAAARTHWDQPGLRYRLLDGDTEVVPGLRLIETSGHAPGHQSVLVDLLHTGKVLLTIDAVPLARLFTPERRAWPDDDNADQLQASTRKLLDLVAREDVALVIFGHDGAQWRTLKTAPASYA